MKFGRDFLDNLRARIAISSVVGAYVNLKPKGRGEYTGLCPFHKEKTPSFTVSDNKGFYHCFGCGVHGDIIRFLTDNRGVPYPEAVKELALQAGIPLPKYEREDLEREKKIEDGYEVLELATKWFEKNLESASGMDARIYLKNRGLTAETISKFRIGYAPDDWEGLKTYLKSKGVDEDIIKANGLLASNEANTRVYDRFRNRIMFPIFNSYGKVIAFGGRIMGKDDHGPKYLNSPETDLFKKGYTLYGFNFAKDIAYREGKIIAVEGYMDVIALHQAGFGYAVAPLGTALTENHIKQLWKIAKEPILCLDGDAAGQRASKKFAEEYIALLEPGNTLKFAFIPNGADPDDFIRENGNKAFETILDEAKGLSDSLWDLNAAQAKLDTPEQKAAFSQKMNDLVATIENPNVRDFYKKDYSSRIFRLGFSKNGKKDAPKTQLTPEVRAGLHKEISHLNEFKERLVLLCAYNPQMVLRAEIEEVLTVLEFENKLVEKLAENAIYFCANTEQPLVNFNGFLQYLEKQGCNDQIEYIKLIPFRKDCIGKLDNDSEILFRWRYLMAEYELALAEYNKKEYSISSNNVTDAVLEEEKELQARISDLSRHRDEKKQDLEKIQENDFI